jgi:hypothetical protein
MSQSDYIHYLKISTELQSIAKLPPVLNSGNYTQYLSYSIENKVRNTKQINSQLTLPNQYPIFDVPTIDISGCPIFLTCNNTNQRVNRVLTPYSGYCFPLRPLTPKQQAKFQTNLSCLC